MTWYTEDNIWKVNPELILFFRDIKENDTSENQAKSSLRMWAICLIEHAESPLKELIIEEKFLTFKDNFVRINEPIIKELYKEEYQAMLKLHKTKELNRDQLSLLLYDKRRDEKIINEVVNMSFPKYKKLLRMWELKLEERTKFIEDIPYSREDVDMLEKVGKETAKMWIEFYRIKKMSEEEKDKVRGDEELSFLEKMKEEGFD